MSEDYKKIALEDVKEGQRVRVVERYLSYTATYEGAVLKTRIAQSEIDLGEEDGDEVTVFVADSGDFYILLLEDVPKPKVVRTEVVTITHYDDGTKTETPVKEVKAPRVIETVDQFEEYEGYLKKTRLRDKDGDYWMYRNGRWVWVVEEGIPGGGVRHFPMAREAVKSSLPMTVVETLGD